MVQLQSATALRLALNAVLPVSLVVCAVWAVARGAGPGELYVISPRAADRVEHAAVVPEVLSSCDTIPVRTPAGPVDTDPPVGVERLGKDARVACTAILVRPFPVWPPHHCRSTLEVLLSHAAASAQSLGQAVVEKVVCIVPFKVQKSATQTTLQFVNDLHRGGGVSSLAVVAPVFFVKYAADSP
jgi:hypothetical protein